jgi:hypothetical protein
MQLLPLLPMHVNGQARSVNAEGTIVGGSILPGPVFGSEVDRAVRWREGVLEDLNTLVDVPGWELQEARAINDAGQILGAGRFQGQPRAWLLTPIPQVPVCPVALTQIQSPDVNGDGWPDQVGLDVQHRIWQCVAGDAACTIIPGALETLLTLDIDQDGLDDIVGLWGGQVFAWLSGEYGWHLIGLLDSLVKGRWYIGDAHEYLGGIAAGYVYRSTVRGEWQYAQGYLQYVGTANLGDHDILLGWNGCWYYEYPKLDHWTQGQCG